MRDRKQIVRNENSFRAHFQKISFAFTDIITTFSTQCLSSLYKIFLTETIENWFTYFSVEEGRQFKTYSTALSE